MNTNRTKEIIESIVDSINMGHTNIPVETPETVFSESVRKVAQRSSVHIVLRTDKEGSLCYLGPQEICCQIKEKHGGKVFYGKHFYHWMGKGSLSEIYSTIHQQNSGIILKFQIAPETLPQICRQVQNIHVPGIILESDFKEQSAYIGSKQSTVKALHQILGGKIYFCGNYWCWEGTADGKRIQEIVETNKKSFGI